MNINIYDEDFRRLCVIDSAVSMIWNERYSSYGDFQMVLSRGDPNLDHITFGVIVGIPYSGRNMVVDSIQTSRDEELGHTVNISGVSLERTVLSSRVVWDVFTFNTTIQAGIMTILDENFVNPSNPSRVYPGFSPITNPDPALDVMTVDEVYNVDNVLDIIETLCTQASLGFYVIHLDGSLLFGMYNGVDRSYDQTENPRIVFSPTYENLLYSSFYITDKDEKNVVLVVGDDENDILPARDPVYVGDEPSGKERKELSIDATSVRRKVGLNEPDLTDEEFTAILESRGLLALLEHTIRDSFEGEVDPNAAFRYGVDFGLGDIVQVDDGQGNASKRRVVEFIISEDATGVRMFPGFDNV